MIHFVPHFLLSRFEASVIFFHSLVMLQVLGEHGNQGGACTLLWVLLWMFGLTRKMIDVLPATSGAGVSKANCTVIGILAKSLGLGPYSE